MDNSAKFDEFPQDVPEILCSQVWGGMTRKHIACGHGYHLDGGIRSRISASTKKKTGTRILKTKTLKKRNNATGCFPSEFR